MGARRHSRYDVAMTMVALHPPKVLAVPLARAVGHGRMKKVPLGSDILQSARDMGIGFGE